MRALLAILLLAAAGAASAELTRRQADVLRRALATEPPPTTVGELVAAAAVAEPSLTAQELAALELALREDLPARRAVSWMVESARDWQTAESPPFVLSWRADQRDELGRPSAPPSAEHLEALAAVLREACAWLDTPIPARIPYRVDLHASAPRVFPREDPRWGIVTPRKLDAVSVAKLALLEVGDLPYLVEPLSLLLGRCRDSAECRRKLFEDARQALSRGAYVPVLDGLQAGALHAPDDPALASALLVVEHLQRLHAPRTIAALLRTVGRDVPVEEARRLVAEVTGQSVRSLDREILRGLQDWDAARDREALEHGARPPPPPR